MRGFHLAVVVIMLSPLWLSVGSLQTARAVSTQVELCVDTAPIGATLGGGCSGADKASEEQIAADTAEARVACEALCGDKPTCTPYWGKVEDCQGEAEARCAGKDPTP